MAGEADVNILELFKAVYSIALLIFSIVIVLALIFDEQTSLSKDVSPVFAFLILWLALTWLSFCEGGQAALVGLPPIERSLYAESHPICWRTCEHAHKGDNLNRFLMGRQFMVLALVFLINMSGAPVKNATVLGLPEIINTIFLESGMAVVFLTCTIGQLNTQIIASQCMLDFVNNWASWFTVKVAMAIEASGLVHASYLIQMIAAKTVGKSIESNEEPRSGFTSLFFWGRVLVSCVFLIFSFFVTMLALFEGKTTMWEGVPLVVSLILFFGLMVVVGLLEAMQIAFFAVAKLTDEERKASVWGTRCCDLLFEGDGHNLPAFMVGRQLCVILCFFFIARVTSMDIVNEEDNLLGVSSGVQDFFNTGLLGALITTIIASMSWQLVASAFPLFILSGRVTYVLLRVCLFLESTGICKAAWVVAGVYKKLSGFQIDEVYVGTADDRATTHQRDTCAHDDDDDGGGHSVESDELSTPENEYLNSIEFT